MAAFKRDMESAGDTSNYNLITWRDLHEAWWKYEAAEEVLDPLPLTVSKIAAVGCLLKAAGDRSGFNYVGVAKDWHLREGFS